MIAVKVVWRILPQHVAEFRRLWREEFKIEDKSGLIFEILFGPMPRRAFSEFPELVVDDMSSPHGDYVTFVNFALWNSWEEFYEQVEGNIATKKKYFEYSLRTRTIMRPEEIRLGEFPLELVATCT